MGFKAIFALLQAGLSLSAIVGGGKSGQQRTTHRLMAGPGPDREESATENYLVAFSFFFGRLVSRKGENVR